MQLRIERAFNLGVHLALFVCGTATAQSPYTLSVPVDEVSVTFRVAPGMPELAQRDIRVFDNGRQQTRVVSFEHHAALPVRAGILFDTSRSVREFLDRNRYIAALYATHFLVKDTDQAFITRFDSDAKVLQSWTGDSSALVTALGHVNADSESRLGGTALFDALYKACRDQFGRQTGVTGNFILLFTDGEDNASHTRMDDVTTQCQQTRTAVYVLSNEAKSRFNAGQEVLSELTAKTGGRIFFATSREEIAADVQQMTGEQRTQYRVVYKPAHLKHDGAFHRLRVNTPLPDESMAVPAGYYAAR